jgi:hypothetical protein
VSYLNLLVLATILCLAVAAQAGTPVYTFVSPEWTQVPEIPACPLGQYRIVDCEHEDCSLTPPCRVVDWSIGTGASIWSAQGAVPCAPGEILGCVDPAGTSTLGVTPSPETWPTIGDYSPLPSSSQQLSECEFRRQHSQLFTRTPYQEECEAAGPPIVLPANWWKPAISPAIWWLLPVIKQQWLLRHAHYLAFPYAPYTDAPPRSAWRNGELWDDNTYPPVYR